MRIHSSRRIVVDGAFGEGNLGDDLLLHAGLESIRQNLVGCRADIEVVVVASDPKLCTGIPSSDSVEIVRRSRLRLRDSDLYVLCGGGLFFSFASPTARHLARLRRAVKSPVGFLTGWRRARDLRARRLENSCALGIGVGPFSEQASARNAAAKLGSLKLVTVRDEQSATEVERLGLLRPRVTGDLVQSLTLGSSETSNGPDLGLVLIPRVWPRGINNDLAHSVYRRIAQVAQTLSLSMTLVAVSPKDADLLSDLPADRRLYYQADRESPLSFARRLGNAAIVVSARAHPLLIADILGVPSIGVGMEPKIAAFANELCSSSRVWSPPFDPAGLEALVTSGVRVGQPQGREVRQKEAWLTSVLDSVIREWLGHLDLPPNPGGDGEA